MTSEDKHIVSNTFDISNSIDTQIFASGSDQFNSSVSLNNYLRENIGEPLSYALAYVIIYRPEDAIEFVSNFLIDWSYKKTRQKLIDHKSNNILMKSFMNEQKENDNKYLSSLSSHQENSHINSHPNDQQELSSYFQKQIDQTNIQQYIHIHDTASGFDHDDHDEIKNNQENNRIYRCQNDNLSSFTYFSKLRDKIIKCDEF